MNIHKLYKEKDINQAFDEVINAVEPLAIDKVNWPEDFPYKPEVSVKIASGKYGVYLIYNVTEQECIAKETTMWAKVFKDSCVEFFVSLDNKESYFNFEFNAVGSRDVSYRNTSKGIKYKLEDSLLEKIQIDSTFPLFNEVNQTPSTWQLNVFIPYVVLGVDNLEGKTIHGNFYKCGDDLKVPHYVSAFPIELPAPSFHCPEFFEELQF